jgi:hypothetical protein
MSAIACSSLAATNFTTISTSPPTPQIATDKCVALSQGKSKKGKFEFALFLAITQTSLSRAFKYFN